jgi:TRAP-type C4-dicarboxylate transport system permease small subunit
VSHSADFEPVMREPEPAPTGPLRILTIGLNWLDKVAVFFSMIALVVASSVLTYSAVARYFFKVPTDWQDEFAVFLLIGVTFMCGAYVQAHRGHVGIQLFGGILAPFANWLRLVIIDLLSLGFCAFFAWKSWTLLAEAVHEGQTTSSTWGAPLWIPYGLMSTGMTLLALRLATQLCVRLFFRSTGKASP